MRKRDAVLGAAALTALGAAGAMKLNDILFRPMVPPPGEVDLPCRRLSIPSGDALLSGALLGEEGPRGRLILAHGMGVSWDYYLPEIRRFTALGYQVLAFSYRGYPGSGGRFQGFPQAARDVAAGMNFAGDGPLTLWGHSMGAYAVCAALALRRSAPWSGSWPAPPSMSRRRPSASWPGRASPAGRRRPWP